MKSRRVTLILASLTLLVLVLSLPQSLRAAFERGVFCLFAGAVAGAMPRAWGGPGRSRFVFHPAAAILLGVRAGLLDPGAGRPPSLPGVLFHRPRRELLQSGFSSVVNLMLMGI